MQVPQDSGTRSPGSPLLLFALLAPAGGSILLLFGGGILLGLAQVIQAADPALPWFAVFSEILLDPAFFSSLLLTFYIAAVSTLLAAAISVPLALIMTQLVRSSRCASFLLQVPLTVPHLVIAVSALLLLAPSGLISRLFASIGLTGGPGTFPVLVNDPGAISVLLVYIWKEVPFITFMILPVLQTGGCTLLDAGRTLGATPWQRFFHIVLPAIRLNLGAAMLIVFAFTFGAYEVPYLLGETYPVPLPVWAYKSYSDVDLTARPEGIAVGLIISAIVILALLSSHLLINQARRRHLA